MIPLEGRRYEVLRLIGEGGFGRVYKCRMTGAGGFSKEVAIKLLNKGKAPEHVLERFRDESRILGLVRDRAIISVDPPTRLEGRWAVVMEYVDGVSCAALVKTEPIPPKPALEIVAEVARALDHVYNAPGPDGEPLRVIHRDIKPDNLQITPAGDVKILDFGIARANFESREANTTANIAGTFGYIAPERMHGEELPAGDIYSLGVVLSVLLTGQRPSRKVKPEELTDDPYVQRCLELVRVMTRPVPEERPSAAVVEREAMSLASATPGTPLRYWARESVPKLMEHGEDELVGHVLTETLSTVPAELDDKGGLTRTTGRIAVAAAAGTLGVTGIVALVIGVSLLTGVIVYVLASQPAPVEVVEVEAPVQTEEPEPVEEVAPEPVDEEEEAEEGTDEEAEEPEVEPEPVTRPRPRPRPKPKVTFPVTVTSVPMGADVYLDGKHLGQTPLTDVAMTEGSHTIRMTMGIEAGERTITVGKRAANKYIWKGGDEWQVRY